jgi:hypothetical protein
MKEFLTVRLDSDNEILEDVEVNVRKDVVLLIPKYEDMPYVKSTTECAINTMWRMTTSLRPNKSRIPYAELGTGKTDDEIDERFMVVVKGMANLMQRMVHSSSWRNGTFEEFDKNEFKRQLDFISRMI